MEWGDVWHAFGTLLYYVITHISNSKTEEADLANFVIMKKVIKLHLLHFYVQNKTQY